MKISESEIHIYSIDSAENQIVIKSLQSSLSADEIAKATRFKFEKDKNNYTIFRATLRTILSKYLNTDPASITFSYSEKGKPFLKDNSIKFNLAHSRSLAVYALTEGDEIGIDTEYKKEMPDAFEIAQRYFSVKENKEFVQSYREEIEISFFNCWTRKEAFLKAIGDGLSYPLADFSVSFRQGVKPEILWIKDKMDKINEWTLYNVDISPDYVTSLAIQSKKKNIVIKNLKP